MRAFRRLLLLAVLAPLSAHAEPDGDKPHASIAPNLAPNLGAAAADKPAPVPAPRPAAAAPVAKPAPVEPVPVKPAPPVTLPVGAPSFELIDRGDTVEIIAHNIKASRTAVLPLRSRLQIPIAGAPIARRVTPGDRTVKLVELDSEDATRVLSVKLGFEYAETKLLSRYAQAIQIGDDLHVLVPRKLPADGGAPKLPDPTLSPSAAAAMARADHTAMLGPAPNPNAPPPPPPPVAIKPEAIKPEVKPAAAVTARVEPPAPVEPPAKIEKPIEPPIEKMLGPMPDPHARPLPRIEPAAEAADDKPDKRMLGPDKPPEQPVEQPVDAETEKPVARHHDKLGRVLAPPVDDTWSKIAMYAALGLGAAGVGVWMLKRRRLHIPPNAEIDILAQRSLGGKARVVWLGAGDHELLVAVTPQAVNLLGQWPRGTASSAMPIDATPVDETFAGRMTHALGPMSSYAAASAPVPPIPRARTGSMPAVARARTGSMARQRTAHVEDIDLAPIPAPMPEPAPAPAPPPPRAVTTEYADEDPDYADYDEHAAEGPPAPIRREPRPSRPAIVLPPVPAAIAAEARIRRDSQFARPQTQEVAAEADKPLSPAVNGILRLRGRTSQVPAVEPPREFAPDADDEMMADDAGEAGDKPAGETTDKEADQAWIKEILAAGGGAP